MQVVLPSAKLLYLPDYTIEAVNVLARNCYQSSGEKDLIPHLLDAGHLGPFEAINATFDITCDRGISHELCRHRVATFCQESTRFCNYSKKRFSREISAIVPPFANADSEAKWSAIVTQIEQAYMALTDLGETVQVARSVLPTGLKTRIMTTFNLREWMWFLDVRWFGLTGKPHPQMMEVSYKVREELTLALPSIFDAGATLLRWRGQARRLNEAIRLLEEECAQ